MKLKKNAFKIKNVLILKCANETQFEQNQR